MIEDVDVRLSALFEEFDSPADPAFAARVIALAAYDSEVRRARRAAIIQVGREALALVAVLVCFCLLTLQAPGQSVGSGDALPLGSPAMIGVALLALWGLVASQNRATA
jgi:hypothetical protein